MFLDEQNIQTAGCDALRWIVHHRRRCETSEADLGRTTPPGARAGRLGRWRQLGEPAHRLRLVREARGRRRQRPLTTETVTGTFDYDSRHRPEPERHERRLRAARPPESWARRGTTRTTTARTIPILRRPHRHRRPRQDGAGRRGPSVILTPVLLVPTLRQPRQSAAGRRGQQRLLPRPRPANDDYPDGQLHLAERRGGQRGVRRRRLVYLVRSWPHSMTMTPCTRPACAS